MRALKFFFSWMGHESFINDDIKRFEKIWSNDDDNLKTYTLSKALKDKIFTKRSKERPYDLKRKKKQMGTSG